MVVGAIVFYAGMSQVTLFEHTKGDIGVAPIIGGILFLLGLIGAFAGVTTWILTGMAPQLRSPSQKDKT